MSGPAGADATPRPLAPVVILCRPQMGENVGAAARAMMLGDFSLDLQVQRFVSLYERSTATRAGGIPAG